MFLPSPVKPSLTFISPKVSLLSLVSLESYIFATKLSGQVLGLLGSCCHDTDIVMLGPVFSSIAKILGDHVEL